MLILKVNGIQSLINERTKDTSWRFHADHYWKLIPWNTELGLSYLMRWSTFTTNNYHNWDCFVQSDAVDEGYFKYLAR